MKQIYVLVVLATKSTRNPYAKVFAYDDWREWLGSNAGESYVKIESSQNKQALEDACLDLNEALTNLNHRLYE